jgi:hypothetical protein
MPCMPPFRFMRMKANNWVIIHHVGMATLRIY